MENRLNHGLLIVFEGIDGTGKSTQLHLLETDLLQKGYEVVTTREPTDGIYGKKIREHFTNRNALSKEQELNLFLDDRKDHVDKLLSPALKDGKIILCDRYYLSTVAYQGAVGFDPKELIKRNDFAPKPDIAFLFCASPKISISRIMSMRGDTPNDFEQEEVLTAVASVFDSLDLPFIHRLDASAPIPLIHESIAQTVDSLIENQLK